MSVVIRLMPRDPVVSRDGRPFGLDSGRRMRSVDWILPTAATGAFRTLVGARLGARFQDSAFLKRIQAIGVRGPFPAAAGGLYFPAPADVAIEPSGRAVALRPLDARRAAGGVDLPAPLRPVVPPADAELQKPIAPPAWWSAAAMSAWLTAERGAGPEFFAAGGRFLPAPPTDERTHVSIDPATGSATPGLLFSTSGLMLDDWRPEPGSAPVELALAADLAPQDGEMAEACRAIDELRPLGGERRLVRWISADATSERAWSCPTEVRTALEQVEAGSDRGVRMVLATPGLYAGGWRPGWIDPRTGEGSPPGCPDVRLRLVGLANRRWQAVSGWSYETRGPKRVRRTVPAGAVYFFEVVDAAPQSLAARLSSVWLRSTGDSPDDRREGWGLALWGVWRGADGS